MVGATFKRINVEDIKNFYVTIPPNPEQEAIGKYLISKTKQFDKIVAKCEAQCSLLQERRTALISAAVTGKIDVREEGIEHVPK